MDPGNNRERERSPEFLYRVFCLSAMTSTEKIGCIEVSPLKSTSPAEAL